MTTDHISPLSLFFTGVKEVNSKFEQGSSGAREELLTIKRGVEDIRKAFFEGNLKGKIMVKAKGLA